VRVLVRVESEQSEQPEAEEVVQLVCKYMRQKELAAEKPPGLRMATSLAVQDFDNRNTSAVMLELLAEAETVVELHLLLEGILGKTLDFEHRSQLAMRFTK
jgi:hypothetical protein